MTTTPQQLSSVQSMIVDLPPSCVVFSTVDPTCFVVGTYHLEAEQDAGQGDPATRVPQQRRGSLVLFKLFADTITILHTVSCSSAVLDIQFSSRDPDILAVATSTGVVMLCRLELSSEPALNQICNVQLFDDSTLVLSLAWHPQDRHLLGVTLSNGAICLLRVDLPPQRESRDILHTLSDEVNRHELEAWTLAWAPFRDEDSETGEIRHIIYSGGDDAKLQVSAYGESDSAEANVYTIHPQKSLKRLHDAGVTAILPLFALNRTEQIMEDVLLTGSYDDHVRVIDPATAQVLTELNLGGGGWRLNLMDRTRAQSHDSRPSDGFGFLVLASCMHAGARVLNVTRRPADVTKGAWSIEILAQFEEHESMNYASAVQPVEEAGEWAARSYTCVSTSFYDRRLCVWKYSEPSEAGD